MTLTLMYVKKKGSKALLIPYRLFDKRLVNDTWHGDPLTDASPDVQFYFKNPGPYDNDADHEVVGGEYHRDKAKYLALKCRLRKKMKKSTMATQQLWNDMILTGYHVRSTGMDGLVAWQPYKTKYSSYTDKIQLEQDFCAFVEISQIR